MPHKAVVHIPFTCFAADVVALIEGIRRWALAEQANPAASPTQRARASHDGLFACVAFGYFPPLRPSVVAGLLAAQVGDNVGTLHRRPCVSIFWLQAVRRVLLPLALLEAFPLHATCELTRWHVHLF